MRMALGAQATQVWWLILRQSIVQLGVGLTPGIAGASGTNDASRLRSLTRTYSASGGKRGHGRVGRAYGGWCAR